MNKLLFAVWLTLSASAVFAACSTYTVNQGGRMVVCTSCCDQWGNCNVTCF